MLVRIAVVLSFLAVPALAASDNAPMVPAAAPGVYAQAQKGDRWHLTVKGHKFVSREDVEKYLAWRAADLTLAQHARWFRFIPARTKTDKLPVPARDPAASRYSFRMENFQPLWRYKLKGDTAWKSWSPYSGAAFFADGKDAAAIADFEIGADITLRKDQMDDADPLGFEAAALSDLLVNQVSPPQ